MKPTVAVVIPVREAERTIQDTLVSAVRECSHVNAELILTVSATDPTARLLRSMDLQGAKLLVAPGPQGIPQLRRNGVNATTAQFIVIAEDHCTFPDGWLLELVTAMDRHAVDVSGGGVDQGLDTYAGWAQYFTRYSNFMPPLVEGSTKILAGNNACYRRDVLLRHADLLTDGFWEAEFNHEIVQEKSFWLCARATVRQHQNRGIVDYIPLRFRHGRCYGARRWGATPASQRAALLLQSPLIPALLFVRAARAVFGKSRNRWRFTAACPLLLVYFLAWGTGEVTGYLTGAGGSCVRTD